ncbi:MAG: TOBE domain-containing protein, partial [Clostridia bacterium]|nr:TOBE domain-containing protein [Clostridia bacterium]
SGTIQQIGTPQDIYNEPANAFVADFIGESNIFDAKMEEDCKVSLCGAVFDCVDPRPAPLVDVVIRPEDVEIVSPEEGQVKGLVEASLFKGVHYEMTVSCGGETWIIHSTRCVNAGETIGMKVAPENIHIMKRMFPEEENILTAQVTQEADENGLYEISFDQEKFLIPSDRPLTVGEDVEIAIDPNKIELCDPEDEVFSGILDSVVWKGSYYEMILISANRRWLIRSQMDEQAGSEVSFRPTPSSFRILKGEVK